MASIGMDSDTQPDLLKASKQTPLHMAISNQHADVVSVFLEHRSECICMMH